MVEPIVDSFQSKSSVFDVNSHRLCKNARGHVFCNDPIKHFLKYFYVLSQITTLPTPSLQSGHYLENYFEKVYANWKFLSFYRGKNIYTFSMFYLCLLYSINSKFFKKPFFSMFLRFWVWKNITEKLLSSYFLLTV